MLAQLTDFRWLVYSGGYRCESRPAQEKEKGAKTFRVICPGLAHGTLNERYPLEEQPALHRQFAALDSTEKAIVSFANQWGPLQSPHWADDPGPWEDEPNSWGWANERTDIWFKEIKKLNALIALWDILKNGGSEESLEKLIEVKQSRDKASWDVDIRFKAVPALKWDFSFHERSWPGFSRLRGGKATAARLCLFDLLNESLSGTCSPWLRPGQSLEDVSLCLTPQSLGGALWWMFAQEVAGEKNLKQCVYCKGYFEVPKEDDRRRQRSDKKYCSAKCRAAAFREKNEPSEE